MTDPTRDALLMAVAEAMQAILGRHWGDEIPHDRLWRLKSDVDAALMYAQRERDNPPESR